MKAFVINLDAASDRLNSCILEAKKINIELIRVSAVNKDHQLDAMYVSAGVMAAWKSHIKALQMFLETGDEFGLILEDDFGFINSCKFQSALNLTQNQNVDMVQFGYLLPGVDTRIRLLMGNIDSAVFKFIYFLTRINQELKLKLSGRLRVRIASNLPPGLVADDCLPGAHAYMVSRKFASSVILLNNPQFLSIDDFYQSLSKMRTFKMYRVRRSLVRQKPFEPWQGNRFVRN